MKREGEDEMGWMESGGRTRGGRGETNSKKANGQAQKGEGRGSTKHNLKQHPNRIEILNEIRK